jgi:hypothetical protein
MIRKFFAIVFILIGTFGIIIGIGVLTELSSRDRGFRSEFNENFDEAAFEANQNQRSIGSLSIVAGSVFLILGIVLLVKTRKIKGGEKISPQSEIFFIQNENIIIQIEKLGNLKEKGLLTNEEFEIQKKKILN